MSTGLYYPVRNGRTDKKERATAVFLGTLRGRKSEETKTNVSERNGAGSRPADGPPRTERAQLRESLRAG